MRELLRLVDLLPIGIAIATDSNRRTAQRNRALTKLPEIPHGENASQSAPAGDCAVITLSEDDGRIRAAALEHADPAMAPIVARLTGTCCSNPNATTGTANVVRTGAPQIVAEITPAFTDHVAQEPLGRSRDVLPGSLAAVGAAGGSRRQLRRRQGERRLRAALTDPAVIEAPQPASAIRDAVLHDGSRDDVG